MNELELYFYSRRHLKHIGTLNVRDGPLASCYHGNIFNRPPQAIGHDSSNGANLGL